jgi:hypothetical protein
MARRQEGAVALAVLVAALLGAVSAKKPHVFLSSLNPPALKVTATPSEKGACLPPSYNLQLPIESTPSRYACIQCMFTTSLASLTFFGL